MGDFSANFKRPESGIYTSEGNVAGSRAARLSKQRNEDQRKMEEATNKIRSDSARSQQNINSKFSNKTNESAADQAFRKKTVGLVTAEEFKRAAEESLQTDEQLKDKERAEREHQLQIEKKAKKKKRLEKKKRKKMLSTLSFANDEDEEILLAGGDEEESSSSSLLTGEPKKSKKNPHVDTSFLPDKQREEDLEQKREDLKQQWMDRQEEIKHEKLEITYSYWDGSGHRRTIQIRKKASVGEFLELVRKDLASEFREMTKVSADALVYVKEDLIIPHDITFYDMIATKARGKSGPLFNFDVHDDLRVGPLDSRVEKDESHPGKVVERRWYDRNKHIFPASRWEVYDPANEYSTYTIHGGEVR